MADLDAELKITANLWREYTVWEQDRNKKEWADFREDQKNHPEIDNWTALTPLGWNLTVVGYYTWLTDVKLQDERSTQS